MDLFVKNLELLKKKQSGLAKRISELPYPKNVVLVKSKTGHLVPKLDSISLHSSYRPLEEAKRQIDCFVLKPETVPVIYGLAFGYHVHELLKRTNREILIVEPVVEIFRSFLSHIDITEFLPRVRFLIGEPPSKIVCYYGQTPWSIFVHRPSYRFSQKYFKQIDKCLTTNQFIDHNQLKVMVINPIYGGSLPTAKYCAAAFKELGHDVCSVNCQDFADSFRAIQGITQIKENSQILSTRFKEMISDVILSKAAEFKPDFILALAQAPLEEATIFRLRTLEVPIAFWFVEDFRTLTYWKDIARKYDYFFTIQKGTFFNELKSKGVQNYYYLPQACSPDVHTPINMATEERNKYLADLSFMGAAYYNRKNIFPRLLDFDFKVWGTGWDFESPIKSRLQNNNERVSTDDSVKIYNSAKINLNLHSSTCHEEINPEGDFVNPRTFEIAACGGFQLVDERSELFNLFDVGHEIVTFRNITELKNIAHYYLKHEKERDIISKKTRDRVLNEHTFKHRMLEMLLFVYHDRLDSLKKRFESRIDDWEVLVEEAGGDTELGKYINKFKSKEKMALKLIIKKLKEQEGTLSQNELLLLMVDQVIKQETNY